MGAATVPLLQKRSSCARSKWGARDHGDRSLESMIEHSEPTRPRRATSRTPSSDGTSALMLSGETAIEPIRSTRCARWTRSRARWSRPLSYRHQAPVPGDERAVRRRDVERSLRHRRDTGARRRSSYRRLRPDGVRRRAPAAAVADHRPLPTAIVGAAARHSSGESRRCRSGGSQRGGSLGPRVEAVLHEGLVQRGDLVVLTAAPP